ncbi:MAG: hypothetical protein AAFX06_10935 [Planctomycetota bacterium]
MLLNRLTEDEEELVRSVFVEDADSEIILLIDSDDIVGRTWFRALFSCDPASVSGTQARSAGEIGLSTATVLNPTLASYLSLDPEPDAIRVIAIRDGVACFTLVERWEWNQPQDAGPY